MSRRERAAVLTAAGAVLTTIAACTVLLPLDLRFYGWVQEAVPPVATHIAARALDVAARTILFTVIVGALWRAGGALAGLTRIADAAVIVAGGAACGELLKTALERLRPSALPDMATGNSLPSGHVMNTTLVAVVAWELAGSALSPRWRRAARAAAVTAVAIQAMARVLRGSHWPSDVAPSVLLGIAWMLGAPALWRMPRVRYAGLVAGAAAYVFFLAVPAVRLHLPSVLDEPRRALATWRPEGAAVVLGQQGAVDAGSGWRSTVLHSDGGTPDAFEVVMRATCERPDAGCRRVRVNINGWTSPEITLSCGWRWYRLQPAASALRAGENDVAIGVPDECPARGIRDVAVRSLSLVAAG
jgi:membrane-associated phospholipid phosphatase